MSNFPTSLPNDASMLKAVDFLATTLNGSFAMGATSLIVASTTGFPDPSGQSGTYYLVIDAASSATREIIGYTGLSLGTTFTGCTRGLFGTTNQAHSTGVTCEQNIVASFHESMKGELLALATKLGINSSGVNTTHDFKLSGVATADKAVSLTGTETLTNKTLTSPTMTTVSITLGGLTFTSGQTQAIVFNGTSQYIVAPITSLIITNHANNANNFVLTDAGALTVANGFTVTAGGLTVTAGGLTVISGTTALQAVTSGTINSQTITSTASFTGSVTVANALTVTTGKTVLGGNFEYDGLNESQPYWMDL